MGSIHPRKRKKGTVYEVVWTRANGSRGSKVFRTKSEASRRLAELMAREERRRLGLEATPTGERLREVYAQYAPTAQGLRSWSTMEGRWKKHILPALGDQVFHQVRPNDITRFLQAKQAEGLSPQTVRHLRVHLQRLYTWAKKEAQLFVGENPASLAWSPKLDEPDPKVLELDELEAVIAHAREQDVADFIAAAGYTGMRRGELIALTWRNVDLKTRLIDVRRSGTSRTTKGGRSRIVPIPRPLLERLERRRKEARSEYVFPAEDGGMRREDYDANGPFRSALARAGLVEAWEHVCVARKPRAPGAKNGRAKLSAEQVAELKQLAAEGATPTQLAARFGVSRRTARQVVTGERWASDPHVRGGCGHKERRPDKAIKRCPSCDTPLWPRAVVRDLNFKDLRSTFITHVVEATGDIRAGQEMAGHASQATTSRHYKKTRARHLVEQVDRVPWRTNGTPIPADETSPTNPTGTESKPNKTEVER